MDFVKDHEELYDKINDHFKDKARKECLWSSLPTPTVASCLSRCARPDLSSRGQVTANWCKQILNRPQRR